MKKFVLLNATTVLLLMAVLLAGAMSTRTAFGILTPSSNVQLECAGLTVVSDTWTLVTAGNVPGPYPFNATYAWEPSLGTDPSYWDNSLNYSFSASGADWIWENHTVVNPIVGDIVNFNRTFEIPCCCCPGLPITATLYITCDNGYEVYLNGEFVGSAQLGAGWSTSDLTESYVNWDGWQSVESWDVSDLLLPGGNVLEIAAANEYMGYMDGQMDGNWTKNPAGLIFELNIACDESEISLVSCEIDGTEEDTFLVPEDVYVKGSNFPLSQMVDIYVIPNGTDPVTVGDAVGIVPATQTTDAAGTLPVTKVWNAPLTIGEYDVWVDMDRDEEFDCTDAYFIGCRVYLFHVIPEYLIGSIGAVLAMFGSFALFRLSKARGRFKNR